MKNNEALEVILASHQHRMNDAAECIADFIEDEAIISSPSLIEALNVLWGSTLDTEGLVDVTTMHVTLKRINEPFALIFAEMWEVCHEHSMDIMICRDDESHQ